VREQFPRNDGAILTQAGAGRRIAEIHFHGRSDLWRTCERSERRWLKSESFAGSAMTLTRRCWNSLRERFVMFSEISMR
jgi:hypothetical protein